MKPMTHEEAILQMELLEHSFFAFKDEENDGVRRNNSIKKKRRQLRPHGRDVQ